MAIPETEVSSIVRVGNQDVIVTAVLSPKGSTPRGDDQDERPIEALARE